MGDFGKSVGGFCQRTSKQVNDDKRAVAIMLFSAIISDSPVLTGRLRANWNCSLNGPDFSISDATDTDGNRTIGAMQLTALQAKGDDGIYLTNSLPYAARIEYEGWSSIKAPAGMVRKNVIRFKQLLKSIVK